MLRESSMIRKVSALGILVTASSSAALGVVAACGDTSVGAGQATLANAGGSSGTTASSGSTPGNGGIGVSSSGGSTPVGGSTGLGTGMNVTCMNACCPSSATCYSAGPMGPGGGCMARIANTPDHMQLRQTWIDITAPKGNTIPQVLQILNTFTQLNEAACNTPTGASGYMQALDLDLTAGVSTLGYTTYVTDTAAATSGGLCFADIGTGVDAANPAGGWKDIADYKANSAAPEKGYDFSLPASQMSPTTNWPPGLPAPMPQPWKVTAGKNKMLPADFNVAADRAMLLQRLSPTGDLGMAGFAGVFYYDRATGTTHGYSPVSWQVIYDPKANATDPRPTSLIAIPIREAEIKYRVNDPQSPNCIGKYLPNNLDPTQGCSDPGMTATKPAWGGIFDADTGEGDAYAQGYFLITELEQVYSVVLQQTLCVSYPTKDVSIANKWATATETRCRKSALWNPSDPANGLPMGDWCAATNGPATPTCHDAYLSKSFHAFQAFKVKTEHCAAL